ncbi:MAG TPA: hypothetical protein VL463_32945 [Kofleriaceae bacterium]|nr:hypothetical protein [Kofleriaceae bacterium]
MKHILITLALALSVGCTHKATMSAPTGFGRLDGPYDFRAVNPVGVVVAARREENKPRSDLGFWSAAVDLQLARKGYSRTAAMEIKSAAGVPGRLMKYDTGTGAVYWVAVYAVGAELLVAEATGWKDDVDANGDAIQSSLLSANLN